MNADYYAHSVNLDEYRNRWSSKQYYFVVLVLGFAEDFSVSVNAQNNRICFPFSEIILLLKCYSRVFVKVIGDSILSGAEHFSSHENPQAN